MKTVPTKRYTDYLKQLRKNRTHSISVHENWKKDIEDPELDIYDKY